MYFNIAHSDRRRCQEGRMIALVRFVQFFSYCRHSTLLLFYPEEFVLPNAWVSKVESEFEVQTQTWLSVGCQPKCCWRRFKVLTTFESLDSAVENTNGAILTCITSMIIPKDNLMGIHSHNTQHNPDKNIQFWNVVLNKIQVSEEGANRAGKQLRSSGRAGLSSSFPSRWTSSSSRKRESSKWWMIARSKRSSSRSIREIDQNGWQD